MQRFFHYDVPAWNNTWPFKWLPWLCTWWFYCDIAMTVCVTKECPAHTQSENKPIYHCWSNDIHLILMVVKTVNILCFDFVILFAGTNAFLCVYKQNKQNGSSFRVNGGWSGLAQLILLGSALISLDKMQMGSAEILGSADPARIRSANTLW